MHVADRARRSRRRSQTVELRQIDLICALLCDKHVQPNNSADLNRRDGTRVSTINYIVGGVHMVF